MADFADTRTSLAGLGMLTARAITAASAGADVTIDVGGTQVTAKTNRDLTIGIGDIVLITRQGATWWVICRTYATPPPAPPEPEVEEKPPPPKPVTRTGTLVVAPVETRSYRAGKWRTDTDDTYQGEYGGNGNYIGVAFYGKKPRSLAGATVTAAYLKLRRESGSGDYAARETTLHRITQSTRPAGVPSFTGGSTAGPSLKVDQTATKFQLPTAWGQDLVDGNAGALAVYAASGSPYLRLSGRASWGSAWTLTLNWKRSS